MPKTEELHRKKVAPGPHRRANKPRKTMSLRERNQGLIRLLNKWMADESGYDEETWPDLKKALQANRSRHARDLFRD